MLGGRALRILNLALKPGGSLLCRLVALVAHSDLCKMLRSVCDYLCLYIYTCVGNHMLLFTLSNVHKYISENSLDRTTLCDVALNYIMLEGHVI